MKRNAWKKLITANCEAAGTYRPYFDPVIETLAGILERRDDAQKFFKKSGGELIVTHTNKSGAKNLEQNPAIRLLNDLNRDALTYWRDLGLTPAGLKKIDEQAMKKKRKSALAEALKELGG
ncbi:MAG: P27 family phage terminase small subunit [Clostridia bacterium]|nr:P27 family phage terminase small subunit [Clostridia bacterium]